MSDLLFTNETEWSARDLRAVFEAANEGVVDLAGGDLLVTAGGAGLSVDVAEGVGFVQGDDVPDQGLYRVLVDPAQNSEGFLAGGIEPADGADPRVDRIVARVYDDEVDASGDTAFRLEVLTGTPTAGATLVNLNGAEPVPDTAMLLANVLVEVGDVAIDPANIDDVRVSAYSDLGGSAGGVTVEDADSSTPGASTILASGALEHNESTPGVANLHVEPLSVVDADPDPPIENVKSLRFIGAEVAAGAGAGEAEVTIAGGGGGGGPDVTDGVTNVAAPTDLEFENADGFEVENPGGGLARVRLPQLQPALTNVGRLTDRIALALTTDNIADDAIDDVLFEHFDASIDLNAADVLSVQTSVEARVRLYGSVADRTADAARAIGVDPTGDHGVYLDVVTAPGVLLKRLTPPTLWADWDSSGGIVAAITNLSGGAAAIDVELVVIARGWVDAP